MGAQSKMGKKKEKNRRKEIEKMRNLLRYTLLLLFSNRPEPKIFKKKLSKKLEFGYTLTSEYKRHVGTVKSIFWNPNTK